MGQEELTLEVYNIVAHEPGLHVRVSFSLTMVYMLRCESGVIGNGIRLKIFLDEHDCFSTIPMKGHYQHFKPES